MFIQMPPFLNSLKTILLAQCFLAGSLMLFAFFPNNFGATVTDDQALRALIITGGHDFEHAAFFAMFQAMPGIQWTEAVQPTANDLYTPTEAAKYDVLVLYDMVQAISEGQKQNLVRLLKEEGKGLVGLHHCIGDYQDWPEFRRILGGRYYLSKQREDGIEYQPGEFLHDQRFTVQIALRTHSITKGLEDFEIDDETYKRFYVNPGVTELLRVNHPKSNPVIGWEHEYGKARVVYIQLGHGPAAYSNSNYRHLVENAIYWASRRKHLPSRPNGRD
jgi:type 1 glutamine amidotransferase